MFPWQPAQNEVLWTQWKRNMNRMATALSEQHTNFAEHRRHDIILKDGTVEPATQCFFYHRPIRPGVHAKLLQAHEN